MTSARHTLKRFRLYLDTSVYGGCFDLEFADEYENHAFGDGAMRWDHPGTIPPIPPVQQPADVIGWLRQGEPARAGDDTELHRPRRANWGQEYETRWLLSVLLQHDLYHSGGINHLRALRWGTDRWPWQQG
jgi:hypothetical protein